MEVGLFSSKGKKLKDINLESSVFGIKANIGVVHQVVKAQMAGARSGTASTKTRAEVRGGGRKPWKQKGTGRARAGSIRSPLWKGGGTVFGPTPRDYSQKVPKKIRKLALRSIFSAKAQSDSLVIVDKFDLDKPATKEAAKVLLKLVGNEKVTVVVMADDINAIKSLRNLRRARVLSTSQINSYDLVDCAKLVMTKGAMDRVTEVLAIAKR
ncbi:MAG: 50S ribosomal protein L4 [Actinomycetota bacterium]|nr:50S ribosomal protein L4 [Actinomycetota bacterium]